MKPEPVKIELPRRLWEQWRHARKQEKAWKERGENLRTQLEDHMGSADTGTINDVPVIIWAETEKPREFKREQFKKDYPELYELYYGYKDSAPRPFKEAEFDPEAIDD